MIVKNIKKTMKIVMGSGLVVAALYMPELLAAPTVPTSPNVPIGSVVTAGADADVMVKNVFGWLLVMASVGLAGAAAAWWGWGLISGLGKLQDDNKKDYTLGSWLQVLVVGLLTMVVAGVMSFYMYGLGTGLIT